jgi:C_GCAxxG_C_C family probable redox protein
MNNTILRLVKLKAKGFCCSQMMLILALEGQGKANPDLVKSVGGLCFGIYGYGEACGALTGGVCLISLFAGKGTEEETADDRYITMIMELTDWFQGANNEEFGGTRCDDILKKFPDRSICGQIVADAYEKCMDILIKHGFDPVTGKGER